MSELRERICLVHELGKLGASEEFPYGGNDGPDVDQGPATGLLLVRLRHTLLDHALHSKEADSHLILDKFADATHPTIAEVVYIVGSTDAII